MRFALLVFGISTVLVGSPLLAQEKTADAKPAAKVTYDEHVRPIFRDHCFTCHRQGNAKSDLELDSYAAAMRGGASGEVVLAGDPDNSRLYALAAHLESPKMPPEQDKLAEAKLAILKNWIVGGALENNGSTAKPSLKPKIDLGGGTGGKRPDGPPPMPEKIAKKPVVTAKRASPVTAIAASPWAPVVAIGSQKQILLYHTDTQELLGVLPFPEGVPQVLKFSRSGSLLLAGGGRAAQRGLAVVFNVKTGERVFEVGDELDCVLAADINEDHTRIAIGGPGRTVKVYSTADGSLVHEIRKHTEWINAIEFSPDGVLLATADRNGGMFVWEAETAREFQGLKGHAAAITDVSWRGDSNVLASCSEDGTVRLWEMNGGTQVKSWNAHPGGAAAVEFTNDGKLATAGRDKLAKLWDQNGAAQKQFEPFADLALEVAVTHDGKGVIAGDWTGEARLFNAADGKRLAQLATVPQPPELVAKAAAERAAAARRTVEALSLELATIEKQAADKAAQASAAAAATTAAKTAADKAAVESATIGKSVTEKTSQLKTATEAAQTAKEVAAKAESERAEIEKILAQKTAAVKVAIETASAAQNSVKVLTLEIAAAEKMIADKAAAAKAAAEKLALDTAAHQKLAVEKAAADKLLAEKTAAVKAAEEAAAKAAAEAKVAAEQIKDPQ